MAVSAQDLKQQFDSLSAPDKKDVAQYVVRSLPSPGAGVVDVLWVIIVVTFAILLLGGAFAVVTMTNMGKDPKDLLPLVTAALGVLAGLLAPSPVQKPS